MVHPTKLIYHSCNHCIQMCRMSIWSLNFHLSPSCIPTIVFRRLFGPRESQSDSSNLKDQLHLVDTQTSFLCLRRTIQNFVTYSHNTLKQKSKCNFSPSQTPSGINRRGSACIKRGMLWHYIVYRRSFSSTLINQSQLNLTYSKLFYFVSEEEEYACIIVNEG